MERIKTTAQKDSAKEREERANEERINKELDFRTKYKEVARAQFKLINESGSICPLDRIAICLPMQEVKSASGIWKLEETLSDEEKKQRRERFMYVLAVGTNIPHITPGVHEVFLTANSQIERVVIDNIQNITIGLIHLHEVAFIRPIK